MDFKGKTALITGSTRGIGLAIAKAFKNKECNVVINGRSQQDIDRVLAQQLQGCIGIRGDVTVPKDAQHIVDHTLSQFNSIDFLVCNVGSGKSVPPGNEDLAEWQRVFALNMWSTTNVVQAATPSLIQSKGSIVCISSICGISVVPGAPLTYSTAKAALNAYVKGISRPLGRHGVRINAVAPGNILFDGSVWDNKMKTDSASVNSMLNRDVPLSRFGTPSEVADLVIYLSSPISSFVTGSIWTIDGGQSS